MFNRGTPKWNLSPSNHQFHSFMEAKSCRVIIIVGFRRLLVMPWFLLDHSGKLQVMRVSRKL